MVSSKGDCLVRDVKLRNGNLGPILVNFEHGRLKRKAVSGLKCKVFSANDSSKICTVGAVVEGGDVVYQGDVERDEGDICHNFLAIRNKKTNKIRIYEASNVTLSPSVASDCGINLDMPDYSEAIYNLNQTFGSKKVKRVADQRKRMEINVDNVKTNLTSAISNIEVKNDITLDVEDDSLASMLPPCNRSATSPADVYPISGILSDEELTHLEEFYTKSIADGTFEKLHKRHHFFNKMDKFISPEDPRNAALLLYADSLMSYCNLPMKGIKKTNKGPCPYSTLIHEKILREFTTRAGTEQRDNFVRPQSMVDKAIAYIIVLCLHIGRFKFDLNHIIENIRRVDVSRIKKISSVLGATPKYVEGSGSKTTVQLRLPLPSPKSLVARHHR